MKTKTRILSASVASLCAATMVFAPTAHAELPAGAGSDDVALLSQYLDWWDAAPYDASHARETVFKGNVTDEGAKVLGKNDENIVAINHAGAADEQQASRALHDADGSTWVEEYSESFGPTLGRYFIDGLNQGRLQSTEDMVAEIGDYTTGFASTSAAKKRFNYPRPFLEASQVEQGGVGDRSRNGENDLNGLAPELDIHHVPDAGIDPQTGNPRSVGYDSLGGFGPRGIEGVSQAFPSGHTTSAYLPGVALSTLLPELGPEFLIRASEAGNNRIVLGVHYPLDVMGGRILGHAKIATLMSNQDYVTNTVLPARAELVGYLTERCSADGLGETLPECIEATGVTKGQGYTNPFTDAVSTEPVTDRASALRVYHQRMDYGFDHDLASSSDIPPEQAQSLLATAFPELTSKQRTEVLKRTANEGGAPLDLSSDGWQRINLAAALSSKVTVGDDDEIISVEPGQDRPSIVINGGNGEQAPSSTQGSTTAAELGSAL